MTFIPKSDLFSLHQILPHTNICYTGISRRTAIPCFVFSWTHSNKTEVTARKKMESHKEHHSLSLLPGMTCDLMVMCKGAWHIERVSFDKDLFYSMCCNLDWLLILILILILIEIEILYNIIIIFHEAGRIWFQAKRRIFELPSFKRGHSLKNANVI